MRILITGVAGFIGSHLALRLLKTEPEACILGIDNLNDYYDPALKLYRLRQIDQAAASLNAANVGTRHGASANVASCPDGASERIAGGATPGNRAASVRPEGPQERKTNRWRFIKADISDKPALLKIFSDFRPEIVVNLAAQAGVSHSVDNPDSYIQSNIIGFYNILEACRHTGGVRHLLYASSSSVYGTNERVPYSTEDKTDTPVSLYAATKKSNEVMAHAYSSLYGIPTTGLRFFSVYGPMGRPDMAYYKFTDALLAGRPITLYANGLCRRDFTYIDDAITALMKILPSPPSIPSPAECPVGASESIAGGATPGNRVKSVRPEGPQERILSAIYNIASSHPVTMKDFLQILQEELSSLLETSKEISTFNSQLSTFKNTTPHLKPALPPYDLPSTYADITPLSRDFGYHPTTPLRVGLRNFLSWYKSYHNL